MGSRARVLGYQFVPFRCFSNPECIILIFKCHALAAQSSHSTAMCKDIHSIPPPRRLTLNAMHMMYQFCNRHFSAALHKITERIIVLIKPILVSPNEKSDVTRSECGAGYRRIELTSGSGTRGEFRCLVCDNLLEAFDGSRQVALRLTVQPGKHQ